ncbi:MAG: hypothetical protein Q9166_002402 [cf. Caloplaca sp. 2 TL-2023]
MNALGLRAGVKIAWLLGAPGRVNKTVILNRRRLSISAISTPPLVFAGLLVTLWAYKCVMMVVFQNKIIYMPSIPPFSRREKIEDYEPQCKPVRWQEKRIEAADGVDIALAVASVTGSREVSRKQATHVAIVYFQGNGGALPPRLPSLSMVLKALQRDAASSTTYTIVGLSYRGYWTSRGRPSERGIGLDAHAAIQYALTQLPKPSGHPVKLILWGQSIGAGVAASAAANLTSLQQEGEDVKGGSQVNTPRLSGLLLETPFMSVRAMLTTIYPQKWLPYRYLGPFLRNHWDSKAALQRIGGSSISRPKVLILQAANDELVPGSQSEGLEQICRDLELDVYRHVISGALHTDAAAKAQGRKSIVEFLKGYG